MYDTVIFDVDGTILDSTRAVTGSLRQLLIQYGRAVPSEEELRFAQGMASVETLRRLGFPDIQRALVAWETLFRQFNQDSQVFPGIPETLVRLQRRGVRLGVVTSKNHDELLHDFVPLGLGGYFNCIVCAEDAARTKPHPDPLVKAMTVVGADPGRTLYVGDTEYDAACAKAAGSRFGLVGWGPVFTDSIAADHVLRSPLDILVLVPAPAEEEAG
ncbi:MAG TPA: HAD family hydrolase [Bacillota bacterium]